MRRILALLMFGILLTAIPASASAQEPVDGAISGLVINDTQGAALAELKLRYLPILTIRWRTQRLL